jgi:L-asparaginase/glutamin-(asparagin-)ase
MLQQQTRRAMIAIVSFLFIVATGAQAEAPAPKLANVTILATGGTIAGTGATSTTTVGYTAATVGVQTLSRQSRNWPRLPT